MTVLIVSLIYLASALGFAVLLGRAIALADDRADPEDAR